MKQTLNPRDVTAKKKFFDNYRSIITNPIRWLIFLPAIIYIPGILGWIPFPSETADYTDLLLTHYPYAVYLRESLLLNRAIPLWYNLIYSGVPFAANPLSGLWYLPGWIALLFPLPAGISFVLALHSIWGTGGFYKFLESEGIELPGSIIGAIAFGLMPKIAAHYGAGHVSMLYAIAWTPWLLWMSRKDKRGWKTGIILGCLFLADPRWAIFAGLLWISYTIAHRHYITKNQPLFYLQACGIALLITSPLILPMLEFMSISTRALMSSDDVLVYSLPPDKLLGLIIPGSGGNPEWFLYPGGLIIFLFVLQFVDKELRKINGFWSTWVGFSLLISMGSLIPGAELFSKLPLVSLLRVPPRALFITGICFAVIGGRTISWLFHLIRSDIRVQRVAFGVIAFTLLFGGSIVTVVKTPEVNLYWGFIFIFIAAASILVLGQFKRNKIMKVILIGITILDLAGMGFLSFSVVPGQKRLTENIEILKILENEQQLFRIYSPSYSIPQDIAVENSIELADGVDPLQIKSYVEFMESATGVVSDGYSVTIPPYKSGAPDIDNINSVPEPFLLGLINVKFLISAFEIQKDGLILIEKIADRHIYTNQHFLPRAWVQVEELSPENNQSIEQVETVMEVEWNPNKIQLYATGPGTLVLSEIHYPGWTASVDGKNIEIRPAYGILRSITLTGGNHEIVFRYHPISVYAGLCLAAAAWLFILWQYLHEKR